MSTASRSKAQTIATIRQAITSAARRRARTRRQVVNGNSNHPVLRQLRKMETDAISTYRELLARLGADQGVDELIRRADPQASQEAEQEPRTDPADDLFTDRAVQEAYERGLRSGFTKAAQAISDPMTGAPGEVTP